MTLVFPLLPWFWIGLAALVLVWPVCAGAAPQDLREYAGGESPGTFSQFSLKVRQSRRGTLGPGRPTEVNPGRPVQCLGRFGGRWREGVPGSRKQHFKTLRGDAKVARCKGLARQGEEQGGGTYNQRA